MVFLIQAKTVALEQLNFADIHLPRASCRGWDVKKQPYKAQREAKRCFLHIKVIAKPRDLLIGLSS